MQKNTLHNINRLATGEKNKNNSECENIPVGMSQIKQKKTEKK